jgi:hypothetical protein
LQSNTDRAGNATLSAHRPTRGNVAAASIYIIPPRPRRKDFHEIYQKLRSFQTRTRRPPSGGFRDSRLKKLTVAVVKYGFLYIKRFTCFAARVMSEGVLEFVNGATHGSICWF